MIKKYYFFWFLACFYLPAYAQWAVYDKEVYDQLTFVNNIRNLSGFDNKDKTYDHYESERDADKGDIKMGGGDSLTILKGLQTRFEDASAVPELTKEEMAKYVGTEADCGQKETNPKHYEACVGLRNLRLQTLVQSHAMLKNLALRREQIVSLIKTARKLTDGADPQLGKLQRATFEIQGQQALMQADALQIKILMDGYKQREQMYITQQAEARKAMLSQAQANRNPRPPKFMPLVKAAPSNN
jgi:predicted nucleic acid-binding protein